MGVSVRISAPVYVTEELAFDQRGLRPPELPPPDLLLLPPLLNDGEYEDRE